MSPQTSIVFLKSIFDKELLLDRDLTDDEIMSCLSDIIIKEKFAAEFHRWVSDNGDKTLRLDYDLSPDSIVFDVGGFMGVWAASIYVRYRSKIYIFEPVVNYYNTIASVFGNNPDIKMFNFGLSNTTHLAEMDISGDESSEYKFSENREMTSMVDIGSFINENNIEQIDLLKINIEGGEYLLLEKLINSGDINKVVNLQVQFHDFYPDAISLRNSLTEALSKTHKKTYCYEFIWENWSRI